MHDACGFIDTACTIDERFERPWQPIIIKMGYMTKRFRACGVIFAIENRSYLGEFEKAFDEKSEGRKSRDTVPLNEKGLRLGLI
jgi:hypothetical protein